MKMKEPKWESNSPRLCASAPFSHLVEAKPTARVRGGEVMEEKNVPERPGRRSDLQDSLGEEVWLHKAGVAYRAPA